MAEFKPASPIYHGTQTDVFTYASTGGVQTFTPSKVPKAILNFYAIHIATGALVGVPMTVCLGTDITLTIEPSPATMYAAIVSGNIVINSANFGAIPYTVKVTYLF